MSIVTCNACDRQVDSDFDAECFMGDTSVLCQVCREDLTETHDLGDRASTLACYITSALAALYMAGQLVRWAVS